MKHVSPVRQDVIDPLAPTIFHEHWWLDIATGGRFNSVEVANNGKRVGWLPYFIQNKFGLRFSVPPRMTHVLGPAVDGGSGSDDGQAYNRALITRELIAKLPPAAIYNYKCHGEVTDVVAFQQENFATSIQFTQEIGPEPPDLLWSNMRKKKRSQIRRAQEAVTFSTIEDPELFWRFYETNVEQRSLRNYYVKDEVLRCIEQCNLRQRGRIYAARSSADGALVAAIWCIWDKRSAYYFMTTRTAAAHDGAVSLLLWEAIQDAARGGLIFDFDGVTNNESVSFFSGFGGRLTPRYKATRTSMAGRLVWEIKESRRANRYFC
jgi:hypothetical protein